jgi:hypothetical protein
MTLRSVPNPAPSGPLTFTLPDPVISRPRQPIVDPESGTVWERPQSSCSACRQKIEVADRIRKVNGGWLHDECAHQVVGGMSVSQKWLMLAESLAYAPSSFRAAQIRVIVRALIEIASADEVPSDDAWGDAAPVSRSSGDDQ